MHSRSAADRTDGNNGRQVTGSGPGRESDGERSRSGRGDRADSSVIERDHVVGGRGAKAEATNRYCIGGQGERCGSCSYHWSYCCHLHRCTAADTVGGDDCGQVTHAGWLGRERHVQRCGRGAGNCADAAVVERDGVVGCGCVEACTGDRDRGCISPESGCAAGDNRFDRGHLHCGSIAHTIDAHLGRQVAGLGLRRISDGKHRSGSAGHRTDGTIVEGNHVVSGSRVEAEAIYQERVVGSIARSRAAGDDRDNIGYLNRRATGLVVGGHYGRQVPHSCRLDRQGHSQRCGRGVGDRAHGAVVEDNRVLFLNCVEAHAANDDGVGVDTQGGRVGRNCWFDRGHLHRRTTADGVAGYNRSQVAYGGRRSCYRDGQGCGRRAGYRTGRAIVKHYRVIRGSRAEAKTSDGQVVPLMARLVVALVTTGATVAIWTAAALGALLVVTKAVKLPADVGLVLNVTVSDVAVADETVPTAPLLNVTVLLAAVVSKPMPLMTTLEALAASDRPALAFTTGMTRAIWTAEPLLMDPVVTMAVSDPPAAGLVEKVTVKLVAVADVTKPMAPLFSCTVFSAAVVEKPKPLIVTVDASAARLAVATVTTGVTVATCTGAPLLLELVVTTAVRMPAVVGLVVNVTVNEVAVAAVTLPTAPLLNTTVLLAAVVLKPKPLIVIVAALAARFDVLLVTTGTTVAT